MTGVRYDGESRRGLAAVCARDGEQYHVSLADVVPGRLRSRRVQVSEFSFTSASVGKLGSTLHLLARNRALGLPADHELIDELANMRLRETTPGVLRLAHDPGRHDDRAIALALAAQAIVEEQSEPWPRSWHYADVRGRR